MTIWPLVPTIAPAAIGSDSATDSAMMNDWTALAEFLDSALKSGETDIYRRALEHFDRNVLLKALAQSSGQQVKAATLLGLSRPTLRSKLRAAGLTVEKVAAPKEPHGSRSH